MCAKCPTALIKKHSKQNDYPVRKSQAPRIASYDFPLYQCQRGCLPCLFGGLHLPVRFAVVMPIQIECLLLRYPFNLRVLHAGLRCRAGLPQCSNPAPQASDDSLLNHFPSFLVSLHYHFFSIRIDCNQHRLLISFAAPRLSILQAVAPHRSLSLHECSASTSSTSMDVSTASYVTVPKPCLHILSMSRFLPHQDPRM